MFKKIESSSILTTFIIKKSSARPVPILLLAVICVLLKTAPVYAEDITQCQKGWDETQIGNHDKAISLLNQCIKTGKLTNDNLAKAYENRGVVYSRKGNLGQAIKDQTKAISLNPSDLEVKYKTRGVHYSNKGDYFSALNDLKKALELKPNYATAIYDRGIVYERLGDRKKAISDYKIAYTLGLRIPALINRMRQYKLPIQEKKTAQTNSETSKKKPDILCFLGHRKYKENEFVAAVGLIDICLKNVGISEQSLIIAHRTRGLAYIKLKRFDKAVSDFNEAVRLAPKDPGMFVLLGHAWENSGSSHYKKAIKYYTHALSLDPNFGHAHLHRGLLYSLMQEKQKAYNDLTKAQKLGSTLPWIPKLIRQLEMSGVKKTQPVNIDFVSTWDGIFPEFYQPKTTPKPIVKDDETIKWTKPTLTNFKKYATKGANFRDLKLKKDFFSDTTVQNSLFRRPNFRNLNIRSLSMRKSNIEQGNLEGAKFAHFNFTDSNMVLTNAKKAEFANAWIYTSSLNYSQLDQANFSQARFNDADINHSSLRNADFSHAEFRSTSMRFSDLRNADFSFSNMNGWLLAQKSDLSGAKFTGASMSGGDFLYSNLTNANLDEASLYNATFIHADFKGASLNNSNISKADFSGVKNLTQEQIKNVWFWQDIPPKGLPKGFTIPASRICPRHVRNGAHVWSPLPPEQCLAEFDKHK
ncbi:tetratricopeptide repeat protein [Terasakiella sp. A23]|uniref:tetratricopeptide repeat protein n=1 Tax=Terasakiella sp. FCG-A23 TaxID=3080561 RepID=UPI002954FB0C|nr:tetratricopeptide repeat protein [Terasakiella sp. A23]MDV7340757.1 tetratricopeptide repeat protein [Terasakiella sp. A23]